MEVWELITADRYEEAIKQADETYQATGCLLSLRNKVYALFHLKRYDECINLSNKKV